MRILLLNQCFYPDVVSTAQHLSDLATELSARGHQVSVIASDSGYDDPTIRFPRRESWRGITITRLPSLALGKKTRWRRALSIASFLVTCSLYLLRSKRFDAVVALTSPPLISVLGACLARVQRARFLFWVMDLNPDEAITAGWLKASSLVASTLARGLQYSSRNATAIIVLDRFMKQRLLEKNVPPDKIYVLPPWAHDSEVKYDRRGRELFRAQHQLTDKFVVMYSGNHSPCHPLDTLLEAARLLAPREKFVFCFVGGGTGQSKVKTFAQRYQLHNVKCLPYQPLRLLSASLSAADLHAVIMGDAYTGIVHSCKIYNILSLGTPILYIGPQPSHVSDIAAETTESDLYQISHGDGAAVVQSILKASKSLTENRNPSKLARRFSKATLLPQMIRVIEGARVPVSENEVVTEKTIRTASGYPALPTVDH